MLTTRQTSEKLSSEGLKYTPEEVADLAKLKVFADARKDENGYWVIPEEDISLFIRHKKQERKFRRIAAGTAVTVIMLFLAFVSGAKDGLDLIKEYTNHEQPSVPSQTNIAQPTPPIQVPGDAEVVECPQGLHPPSSQDTLYVIVFPFDQRGRESTQFHEFIYDTLDSEFSDKGVVIEKVPFPATSPEMARRIGKNCDADFAIWGWYEEEGVSPHIETCTTLATSCFQDQILHLRPVPAQSGDLGAFNSFVVRELPDTMSLFLYTTMGYIYYSKDDYQNATIAFGRALDLDLAEEYKENAEQILFYRGKANLELMHYAEALDDWEKAIELNPDDTEALICQSVALMSLGRYEEAKELLDSVASNLVKYPDSEHKNALARAYLNRAFISFEQKNFVSSRKDCEQALELDPSFLLTHACFGFIHLERKEYDLAISAFIKAEAQNKDYPELYNAIAVTYSYLGNNPLAVENFNIAIKLSPNMAELYCNRGTTYAEMDETANAKEDFQTCLRLSAPEDETRVRADAELRKYDQIP
jgi:tetratricopeptide (TPR) repeat protein